MAGSGASVAASSTNGGGAVVDVDRGTVVVAIEEVVVVSVVLVVAGSSVEGVVSTEDSTVGSVDVDESGDVVEVGALDVLDVVEVDSSSPGPDDAVISAIVVPPTSSTAIAIPIMATGRTNRPVAVFFAASRTSPSLITDRP
jgi:hypothetical protein